MEVVDVAAASQKGKPNSSVNIDISVLKPLIQNMELSKGQENKNSSKKLKRKRRRNKEAAEKGVDYSDEKEDPPPETDEVVDLTGGTEVVDLTAADDEGGGGGGCDTSAFNSSFVSEENSSNINSSDQEEEDNVSDGAANSSRALLTDLEFTLVSKDRAVLVLQPGATFHFKGTLLAKVLKGAVRVLGARLTPSSGSHRLYSPRGYSLLSLTALPVSPAAAGGDTGDLCSALVREGLSLDQSRAVAGDTVLVLSRLDEPWLDYLHKATNVTTRINLLHRDANLAPAADHLSAVERALDVNLLDAAAGGGRSRLYQTGEGWDVAMTSVGISRDQGDQPRLVVAGGKGVGKSTFVRWLVNSQLERSRVMTMMITR